MLQRRGWKVVSISGDKQQKVRTKALQLFKDEDYVQRIGRTGRAGKKGVAHTFFMKENKALSSELLNVLREAGQNVPTNLLNFDTHVKKKESKLYGANFKEIYADAPEATKITFDSENED
ncbi:hypothetical protein M8C21_023697 [Ambrosia artemisiifolia]|uniref:Uncharacterized protein n=1 Tax=Ambrosia artemisiifolia TaxID=4212 RepID=A0AAD5C6U2_AMBAR|nr:hypothetical protein M8C21_023697 [Ambrosia artemisiifolia]